MKLILQFDHDYRIPRLPIFKRINHTLTSMTLI